MVDVLKSLQYLDEVMHDLVLDDASLFLQHILDVRCQVAAFTVLHDDDQRVHQKKVVPVGNDVWMIQTSQERHLLQSSLALLAGEAGELDGLGDVIRVLFAANQMGLAVLTTADDLEVLIAPVCEGWLSSHGRCHLRSGSR